MKAWYRPIAAVLGWFVIVLQYILILRYKTDGDVLAALIRLLAYFTILSNILVALAMTLPWLAPGSKWGAFFDRPSVRTAIAAYIIVVSAIYYLVLRKLWNPEGWQYLADTIEHAVAPALYVVDWLLFVPKRGLSARSVPYWILFPLGYACYSLFHGAVTGFYPYPFLDVTKFGYGVVVRNMAFLTAVFGVLGLALIGLGRILPDVGAARKR